MSSYYYEGNAFGIRLNQCPEISKYSFDNLVDSFKTITYYDDQYLFVVNRFDRTDWNNRKDLPDDLDLSFKCRPIDHSLPELEMEEINELKKLINGIGDEYFDGLQWYYVCGLDY